MTVFETLTISIELGNDAMQTPAQAADALRTVADRIENNTLSGVVVDDNGNTVGHWNFER